MSMARDLNDAFAARMGQFGSVVIADTTATAGTFCAIYALADTVINAATVSNVSGISGITLSAGQWLYGWFTSIKLTSGSVVAYTGPAQL